MIHNARDLSPDQKTIIEALLGRHVSDREAIRLRAFEPAALSDRHQREVLRGLESYFAQVDKQRLPVTAEEANDIINEGLRSTRPNYRPVR